MAAPIVTPRADDRSVVGERRGWNPWRALRDRPHLELVRAPLPATLRGGILENAGDVVIVLADHLDRVERNATLAHELVHDERRPLPPAGAPPAVRAKIEGWVDREACRRLVPLEQLAELVDRLVAADVPVGAVEVMEAFEVPIHVAHHAMALLEMERNG